MKKIRIVLSLAMLGACTWASAMPPQEAMNYSIKDARTQIAKQFHNPSAVKFNEAFAIYAKGIDQIYVCGSMATGDTAGQFAGNTRFVATYNFYANEPSPPNLSSVAFNVKGEPMVRSADGSGKRATWFDDMNWNQRCVDDKHSRRYSEDEWGDGL